MATLPRHKCLLVSDFNLENFAAFLQKDSAVPLIEPDVAPFGQYLQTLLQAGSDDWRYDADCALVWTRAEAALPEFHRALNGHPADEAVLIQQVDDFAAGVDNLSRRVKYVLVACWVMPPSDRGLGLLDLRPGLGAAHLLMQANLRLAQQLGTSSSVYMLNAEPWMRKAGPKAYSPKLWHSAKVPYGHDVFKEAVLDVKSAAAAIAGQSKKLVVLDLDDTLWGGVVGEIGWDRLRLGGHDPIGEAFVEFQRALQALSRRGILLGIVSKNEEEVAMEALTQHPEMVLRPGDFAGWRINWSDKAQNIADLAAELNLGLQSTVFIDDHPVERERVRQALPEVFVPEWPEDKLQFTATLHGLRCFDAPTLSLEDRARTANYRSERARSAVGRKVGSFDEWLAHLEMAIRIESLTDSDLARTTQLLNKTNQMNLTTRRVTEKELADWCDAPDRMLFTVRVSDKFGDSGLCGVASLEFHGDRAQVVDFVLSCRVMGRRVEETMLWSLFVAARRRGADRVSFRYLPTSKNAPCLKFLAASGLAQTGEHEFTWDTRTEYPQPSNVSITGMEPEDGAAPSILPVRLRSSQSQT